VPRGLAQDAIRTGCALCWLGGAGSNARPANGVGGQGPLPVDRDVAVGLMEIGVASAENGDDGRDDGPGRGGPAGGSKLLGWFADREEVVFVVR
jgi:hypothetical protein